MISKDRGYTMENELNLAAQAMFEELQSRSLPCVQLVEAIELQVEVTDTRGYAALLGSLCGSLDIALWLDRYIDRPEPCFWFGFGARRPEPINELVHALPPRLMPTIAVVPDDLEEVEGWWVLNLTDDQLGAVIREAYPDAPEPEGPMFCLGKYVNGSLLNVPDAAGFLYEVAAAFALNRRYVEGACGQVTTNRYERDPRARQACLNHFGYGCRVCGMSFQKVYGERGEGFIHVHHIERLANGERIIDPTIDLIPVCPNCHAMLHKEPPI